VLYCDHESVQGFIADNNYFVDRYTAYIIAAIANQVHLDADTPDGRMLFSEDLW
jgi:hypothetical protein